MASMAAFGARQDISVLTEPVRTFEGHTAPVLSIAVSGDGKTLAAGSTNNLVKLWRASDGEEIRTLGGHEGSVTGIAFSPDGRKIAAGSWGTKLFTLETGKQTHVLEAHTGFVTCVAYSPNGKTIVTGGLDATARFWDSTSGLEQRALKHPGGVSAAVFTADGKSLITTGDTAIKVWNLDTHAESASIETRDVTCASLNPNGKYLATGHLFKSVSLWDTSSWKDPKVFDAHEGRVMSVAFSPDGKWLATAGDDKLVKLWNAESGKPAAVLKAHEQSVNALAFTPDSKHLATASADHSVMLWELPGTSKD